MSHIYPYNTIKGCSNDIRDFHDLMIIKIQNETAITYSKYENGKYIRKDTNLQVMGMWKKWFDENGKNILIDDKDYSLLSSIDQISKMDNNSFVQFVSKINNRIRVRGLKMVKNINTCEEVKDNCDKLIKGLKNYF